MDVGEGPDALRVYLTGAGVDGGGQPNCSESLGYARSGAVAESLSPSRYNALRRVRIDFVAGMNGAGLGCLEAVGASTVRWTPPGAGAGPTVAILDGETRVLPGPAGSADKYVVVTRTESRDLEGRETTQLLSTFGNMWGGGNYEDSTAELVRAGDFHALVAVTGLTVWIEALGTVSGGLGPVLGASGAGTIGKTGAFLGWRARGLCQIRTSAGVLREIVYYSGRTDDALTVETGGRARLGTSAAAGAAGDVVYDMPWCQIGIETAVDGLITDLRTVGETGTPAIAFSNAITEASGLVVGDLEAAALHGLWVKRTGPDYASVAERVQVKWKYGVGGVTYYGRGEGLFRSALTAQAGVLIYVGTDGEPDYDGAPEQIVTASPAYIELTAGHEYQIAALPRNKWDVVCAVHRPAIFEVDDEGAAQGERPNGPDVVTVSARAEGKGELMAAYYPAGEGSTLSEVRMYRAQWWLVYMTSDGTDPDEGDTPVVTPMLGNGDRQETLRAAVEDSYLEDQPLRFLVRTRRVDVVDEVDVNRDSENVEITELLARWFGGQGVKPRAHLGRAYAVQDEVEFEAETVYVDAAKGIRFEVKNGRTEFWAGSVLIWCIHWTGEDGGRNGVYTTFTVDATATIEGAAGAESAIEVGTWTEGVKIIYVNVRDVRRMVIDVVNRVIGVTVMSEVDAISGSFADAPAWRKWGHTCFQVWAGNGEGFGTGMELQYGGTLAIGVPWAEMATEGECL